MPSQVVVGRFYRRPGGDVGVLLMANWREAQPHANCAKTSWCQPPDVALAALQKEYPLPARR